MKNLKKHYRFGFLGAGKMAQAILRGLLRSGLAHPEEILISRSSAEAVEKLSRELKVDGTTDNRLLAARCRWIWLGIKPFHAAELLPPLAKHLSPKSTVLSMMAGISTRSLRFHLGRGPALVRLMPNTPALLGSGMTGVFLPKNTPSATRKSVEKILSVLGEVAFVSREAELDAVTGLSGSGPAFVYELAIGMIEGGMRSGLKPEEAKRLTAQTLLGAARMLQESGH
ncbi:MAG: pyrroline-5-carboxylate reductase, partial [Deltaproteobacteria bacterium]|nr:pyrroline-5-carboxylate reductase [Deltaproteobacteria bacterium]